MDSLCLESSKYGISPSLFTGELWGYTGFQSISRPVISWSRVWFQNICFKRTCVSPIQYGISMSLFSLWYDLAFFSLPRIIPCKLNGSQQMNPSPPPPITALHSLSSLSSSSSKSFWCRIVLGLVWFHGHILWYSGITPGHAQETIWENRIHVRFMQSK